MNNKTIYNFEGTGKLIAIFDSVKSVLELYPDKTKNELRNAINNKTLYKGSFWSDQLNNNTFTFWGGTVKTNNYKNVEEAIDKLPKGYVKDHRLDTPIKITIKNIETGELKNFKSKKECISIFNISYPTLCQFLKGTSKLNKKYEVIEIS